MPASLDPLSTYGWVAYGFLTAFWLAAVVKTLVRPRQYGGFVALTVVMAVCGTALVYNDRWGPSAKARAKYERTCSEWRRRYDAARTVLELERARDRLREERCRIMQS